MSASRVPLVAPEDLKQSWRDRLQAVDAAALEKTLLKAVTGEVRFDAGSRALYATDGSNYRQVPIGALLFEDHDALIGLEIDPNGLHDHLDQHGPAQLQWSPRQPAECFEYRDGFPDASS